MRVPWGCRPGRCRLQVRVFVHLLLTTVKVTLRSRLLGRLRCRLFSGLPLKLFLAASLLCGLWLLHGFLSFMDIACSQSMWRQGEEDRFSN
jgi:hypothetical protein